jgi:polysaccharide biosynthesis/export protein
MSRRILALVMLSWLYFCASAFAQVQVTPVPGVPVPSGQGAPGQLSGGPVYAPSTTQPTLPPVQAQAPGYVVGAGDQIRITVFGEPELTGDYNVGAQGSISYALIGDVPVAGLSTEEVAALLATRLRDGYLQDPRVSVAVVTYRPFYILGEVQRPGTYPYAPDLTVMSAVATAGGFTYRANQRMGYIRSVGGSERRVVLTGNIPIRPGDTIRIGERWF